MSEFTNSKDQRVGKLMEVSKLILETGSAHSFIEANKEFIGQVVPSDFIALFDEIIKDGYDMAAVKVLTNKVLNIFHATIDQYERLKPQPESFLGVLEQNNHEMALQLKKIRPVFKAFVSDPGNRELQVALVELLSRLESFTKHYVIKENVLFPILEEKWEDYRCLQIMWSFHDDIRRNIKAAIAMLNGGDVNLKVFNKYVGDIFFNMLAIKFREERLLFPYILSTIGEEQLERMNREGFELGYPYVEPHLICKQEAVEEPIAGLINLGTGLVSLEQIQLIFNHLPVDITFVDEHNRVCYFSTPAKRIFPRTAAIIGREVSKCHPPESVHVVERIVDSFRNGEKDKAEFWIRMRGEFILIQYFAVRDHAGRYKGVLEVSQEITGIRSLEGEKRLLDW